MKFYSLSCNFIFFLQLVTKDMVRPYCVVQGEIKVGDDVEVTYLCDANDKIKSYWDAKVVKIHKNSAGEVNEVEVYFKNQLHNKKNKCTKVDECIVNKLDFSNSKL